MWVLNFLCIIFVIGMPIGLYHYSKNPNVFNTSIEQANEALKHIQEVSKWMATVQIGFLAALGTIVAGETLSLGIEDSFGPFVFLISSLICSSIVLTSIPSVTLRLDDKKHTDSHDVLVYPVFSKVNINFHLGYFITLQQWFWGGSLVMFLWLIAKIIFK